MAATGFGGALVIGAAKFFGQRLIDASIARRLETTRHSYTREIEEMKFEFQRTFDRRTRIIQIELEIVPKAWSLLLDATNKTKAAQARFRLHNDIGSMSASDLNDWLVETKLHKYWHKAIVEAPANERQQLFSKADDARLSYEASAAAFAAREFLAINAILIPTSLYEDFSAFSKMIDDAAFDARYEVDFGKLPKADRLSENFWTDSSERIEVLSKKVRRLLTEGNLEDKPQK